MKTILVVLAQVTVTVPLRAANGVTAGQFVMVVFDGDGAFREGRQQGC